MDNGVVVYEYDDGLAIIDMGSMAIGSARRIEVHGTEGTVIHAPIGSGNLSLAVEKDTGDYKACFTAENLSTARATTIALDWKVGAVAADWDGIAKREHLDRVGIEMKRLQELTKEIHEEMLLMRKRESEMRDLSEATNTRVAWLSVGSLLICVGSAVTQGLYLKKFFKRRKIV